MTADAAPPCPSACSSISHQPLTMRLMRSLIMRQPLRRGCDCGCGCGCGCTELTSPDPPCAESGAGAWRTVNNTLKQQRRRRRPSPVLAPLAGETGRALPPLSAQTVSNFITELLTAPGWRHPGSAFSAAQDSSARRQHFVSSARPNVKSDRVRQGSPCLEFVNAWIS